MKLSFLKLNTSILLFLAISTYAQESYNKHKIADIKEASGIAYCKDSKTLIVANDEGSFYEITLEGKPVARHKLGDFDLEGVVCEKEYLIFAVEKGALLKVDRTSLKTKYLKLKGESFKISKKAGIEGITKVGKYYYLAIQSDKKKNAKLLIVKAGDNYAKVIDTIEHKIVDSAGLHHEGKQLYIVSDTKNKLYIYNLKKNKIDKKIKLPKFNQEGITFDVEGNVYLADDQGAVLKYTQKELGL